MWILRMKTPILAALALVFSACPTAGSARQCQVGTFSAPDFACGGDVTGTWVASGDVCSTVFLGDAPEPATLVINGDQTLTFSDGGYVSTVNGQTYVITVPNSYFATNATLDAGPETFIPKTCEDLNSPSRKELFGTCVATGTSCVCTYKLANLAAQGPYSTEGTRLTRPHFTGAISSGYCVKNGVLEVFSNFGFAVILQYEKQ